MTRSHHESLLRVGRRRPRRAVIVALLARACRGGAGTPTPYPFGLGCRTVPGEYWSTT